VISTRLRRIVGLGRFFFKCDDAYSPSDEIAIRWNDPAIGIDWGIDVPSLSARDANAP
jgi:dTDP-4-dehydrorhamnose 3,5-epimerase